MIDDSGAVVPTEVVTAELESRGVTSSVRWAVIIEEDNRPRLQNVQIQALPDNPEVLMGKPTLRG